MDLTPFAALGVVGLIVAIVGIVGWPYLLDRMRKP